MNKKNGELVVGTLNKLLHQNGRSGNSVLRRSQHGVTTRDLEVALTVVLVDIASSDEKFDPGEYHIIQNALKGLFNTTKDDVTKLINQAKLALANLRGVSRYANLLKEHLSEDEKRTIMKISEEMIDSDGNENGFEVYHKMRLAAALGFEIRKTVA